MPDSVLRERISDDTLLDNRPAVFIGEKPRLSTCSDVTWIGEDSFAACNLNGQALHSYRLNAQHSSVEHQQTLQLHFRAGGIDYFEDDRLIALTNSSKKKNIELYHVTEGGEIQTPSFRESKKLGRKFVHGTQFSPDGKFVFAAHISENPSVIILERETLNILSSLDTDKGRPNHFAKSFCFSPDKKWLFCAWASNAKFEENDATSYISVHAYDPFRGKFSTPLYTTPLRESHLEGITMIGDDSLIAVDQYGSRILQLFFDVKSVVLSSPVELYKTTNGWSSLHGVEISPSNKSLAVTDHVLDAVHLFNLSEPSI